MRRLVPVAFPCPLVDKLGKQFAETVPHPGDLGLIVPYQVVSGVVPQYNASDDVIGYVAFAAVHPGIDGVSALAEVCDSYEAATKAVDSFHNDLSTVL